VTTIVVITTIVKKFFGALKFKVQSAPKTRLSENVRIQLRVDMFNSFNSRNFGIPNGALNSGVNFLNQWATNGDNR
jgi:hypothetical protein